MADDRPPSTLGEVICKIVMAVEERLPDVLAESIERMKATGHSEGEILRNEAVARLEIIELCVTQATKFMKDELTDGHVLVPWETVIDQACGGIRH